MRWIIGIFFGVAALGVAIGFGGRLHPAGDSIALLRPVLGALCLLGLIVVRPKWLRATLAAAGISAAVTILPVFASQKSGDDLRLYAKNLWWANEGMGAVAQDIRAAEVDVVLLQEVSFRNEDIMDLLVSDFPYQHRCATNKWMSKAVLSRTPFEGEQKCSEERGIALAAVNLNGVKIWVGSLHIPWPWPYESDDNEAAVEALLSDLDAPVVIAGDFNAFPWTARVNRIVDVSDTMLAGPTRPTLTLWNMPLPIDHVLAPGGGTVERRPLLGSDHRGLVADVSLQP